MKTMADAKNSDHAKNIEGWRAVGALAAELRFGTARALEGDAASERFEREHRMPTIRIRIDEDTVGTFLLQRLERIRTCAHCLASEAEVASTGHRELDGVGHPITDQCPSVAVAARTACPQACSCTPECFSMAEHRAKDTSDPNDETIYGAGASPIKALRRLTGSSLCAITPDAAEAIDRLEDFEASGADVRLVEPFADAAGLAWRRMFGDVFS